MPAHTFACPSCGASLTARPDQNEIICSFCGASVIVPEELRDHPTPQPQQPQAQIPPVIVVEPPPIVIQQNAPGPIYRRQRRRGCGCCGPMIGLLVLAVVIAFFVYIQRPAFAQRMLAQVESLAGSFSSTPQIFALTASPVSNRNAIVVAWAANAESVRLDWITPQGTQALSSLPPVGEHTFVVNTESGETIFRLTAVKNGKTDTRTVNVAVRRRQQ